MQLEHAQDFHMPPVVPPTPQTVSDLVEHYHSRARRVIVWRVISRQKKLPLLSVSVEPTKDTAAQICRLVVARCQADENEQGQAAQYAVQLELENIEKKPKPPRVTVQFWLGPEGEITDHAPDPLQWDQMMQGQVQILFAQINEQAKMIVHLGEVAINRVADSFNRERQALEIVADARVELEHQRQQGELERAKLDQNQQLLEVAKPAVAAFAEQAGAHLARKAGDAKRGGSASSERTKPAAIVLPTAPATAETVTAEPVPELEHTDREIQLEALRGTDPLAYVAGIFGDTIDSRAWFEISEVFSKRQIRTLRACCDAANDERAIAEFGKLAASFKDGQRERLEALLDGDQRGMIAQLWLASAAAKRNSENDSGSADPKG